MIVSAKVWALCMSVNEMLESILSFSLNCPYKPQVFIFHKLLPAHYAAGFMMEYL